MKELLDELTTGLAKLETLSLVFSNFGVACGKTRRPNQARLFDALARSCNSQAQSVRAKSALETDRDALLNDLLGILRDLRARAYEEGIQAAAASGERGVLRAMTWGQKVTAIQASLVTRLIKSGANVLGPGEAIHVCSACGFVIVKGQAPEVCPICKAPARQFIAF